NYAGKSKDKAAIVAHAVADPARKAEIAKWKAEHPQKPVVQIFGDTAVLMWTADAPDGRINSCDIFAYRDGHWRAVYSQDTKVDGRARVAGHHSRARCGANRRRLATLSSSLFQRLSKTY